jgi:hypothetical protein
LKKKKVPKQRSPSGPFYPSQEKTLQAPSLRCGLLPRTEFIWSLHVALAVMGRLPCSAPPPFNPSLQDALAHQLPLAAAALFLSPSLDCLLALQRRSHRMILSRCLSAINLTRSSASIAGSMCHSAVFHLGRQAPPTSHA